MIRLKMSAAMRPWKPNNLRKRHDSEGRAILRAVNRNWWSNLQVHPAKTSLAAKTFAFGTMPL
jgi:hypothetical protein